MEHGKQIYEGKAKILYETSNPDITKTTRRLEMVQRKAQSSTRES